jgi:hypothetical protein
MIQFNNILPSRPTACSLLRLRMERTIDKKVKGKKGKVVPVLY